MACLTRMAQPRRRGRPKNTPAGDAKLAAKGGGTVLGTAMVIIGITKAIGRVALVGVPS